MYMFELKLEEIKNIFTFKTRNSFYALKRIILH